MNPEDVLSQVPYLAGLPESEIERLGRICNVFEVPSGRVVIEEGAAPGDLFVILEGSFRAVRAGPNGDVVLGTSTVGEVIGEMSLIEDRPTSATVIAQTPGKLLRIPGSEIGNLMNSPQMTNQMLRTVIPRLREREAALGQAEKLAALGTMTAGLLHEVNNPAAALQRAGSDLAETTARLVPSHDPEPLTPLQRSDRTRAVAAVLVAAGADPKLAGSLVALGWNEDHLAVVPESELAQVAGLAHVRQLANEVVMAATRLAELVGTVKRWTYHDQGELHDVDLVTVVEDSLTLLRHKTGTVQVTTRLPESLQIEGRGGELSQVVTNLLDNAIDAQAGEVVIELSDDDGQATLIIEDDGNGIPPEKAERIWEPFFTTKAPGKGTGLGLALSQRIIIDHGGSISLESQPGRTRFLVRLPKRRDR